MITTEESSDKFDNDIERRRQALAAAFLLAMWLMIPLHPPLRPEARTDTATPMPLRKH